VSLRLPAIAWLVVLAGEVTLGSASCGHSAVPNTAHVATGGVLALG
jgi:hypothetical protein